MPQIQKAHVRGAILRAAAAELAEAGYEGATLAAVAARAGTSIGNLYKYFASKEELIAATVPPGLVQETEALLCRRIEALGAERDTSQIQAGHPYLAASEALLELAVARRHELLFLLRHAQGTAYSSFAEDLAQSLTRLALAYGRRAYPEVVFSAAARRALARIYRVFLGSIASILAEERGPRALRAAVLRLTTYHLAGMRAFFEAAEGPAAQEAP